MKSRKIVVIGGSGLIGRQVVANLRALGHEVLAASPSKGVDTVTGEGLAEALQGADIVIDVANSPSFEDGPVMEFFQTSGRNLLAAEKAAGVKLHVALSVVGTERLQASGYFRAKLAQEQLIQASPIPYSIVRATQFFEFVPSIAASGTQGDTVIVSDAMMQPIASADVAAFLTDIAVAAHLQGMLDIAGPDPIRMDALVKILLMETGDHRNVTTDPAAGYFGTPVDDTSLVPAGQARLGKLHYADWLKASSAVPA